jgi:hypothetical protein
MVLCDEKDKNLTVKKMDAAIAIKLTASKIKRC